MKKFVLLLIVIVFVSGCDGWFTDDAIDFETWMTCPTDQEQTSADFAWIEFEVSASDNLFSGDSISLSIKFKNAYDSSHPDHPDISQSSSLRVFMEAVDAEDPTTIDEIGPEDWFLAEFTIPGMQADETQTIVDSVTIPKINIFSVNAPEEHGAKASFKVYGVLDAQNCIGERDEANNLLQAKINGKDGTLDLCNPYLPNLQIRFLKKSPTTPMPETGGTVATSWEIFNAGKTKTHDDFNVTVYLSGDGEYDPWDVELGHNRVKSDIGAYSSQTVAVSIEMPYVTWRNNGWSLYSSLDMYDPKNGDSFMTREPPIMGPPGYYFTVYPCIQSTSQLIAYVDSAEDSEVNESIETDNCSNMGYGPNGTLDAEVTSYPSAYDINLVEFRAENYISHSGGYQNVYDISLIYNAGIQFADNCSFGFYWSKGDQPQFGDYFIQRYWFMIQPGINILLYPFGIHNVWRPDPLPAPGTYRMVLVMDDIFKFNEPDETNNAKASFVTATVR